ncbi:MAG: thiol:disulfide interchange protein, partial [Prevotellaceae bacterium]|nr:thiol:disulfide interchange protein [Prevotellaceae bacterium]
MRKIFFILHSSFFILHLQAQILTPVKWTFSETAGKQIELKAGIENGWYIYDTQPGGDDYVPTSVTFTTLDGAKLDGDLQIVSKPAEKFDATIGKKIFIFENEAVFRQNIKIENPESYLIEGYVRFMACNSQLCLAPVEQIFSFGNKQKTAETESLGMVPFNINIMDNAPQTLTDSPLWQPIEQQSTNTRGVSVGLWTMFVLGLIGGLIALVTPCVWPIIPFTLSFFLKRSGNHRKNMRDAFLYGVSIIVIYVGLGLLITVIYGASALNSLSTSAFFNLFFFALLVVFGISFLGAFEITLPSSWSSKVDARAESSKGIWGIFLMAFTLALVSFSCTGPIIGTLLVTVSVE